MYALNYIWAQQRARGILPPKLSLEIMYKMHVSNSYPINNSPIMGKSDDR
jgi:hypothetical protein